jgi:hypothetical protein
VRAQLGLVALAALLLAASSSGASTAAFTVAKANPSNSFVTAADWVAPAVTVSAPTEASSTSDATPTLSGTAGSATGDGATVTARIYSGSAATGTPVQTLSATRSGTAWSATAAALADGTYAMTATQSDSAGNAGTSAPRTFTVDTVRPTASSIATANASGGTAGRLGAGDSVTYTFSEPIAPTSVLSTFTGSSAGVTVRFFHLLYADRFTVLDGSGAATVRLDAGTATNGGVYSAANLVTDTVIFPGTLTRSADGRSFTVTFGTPDRPSRIVAGPAAGANMVWTPKTGAADPAGNALTSTTAITQTGSPRAF